MSGSVPCSTGTRAARSRGPADSGREPAQPAQELPACADLGLGRVADFGHDRERRPKHHRRRRAGHEVDRRRLTGDQPTRRRGHHARDPVGARLRDHRRGGIEPVGRRERGRHRVLALGGHVAGLVDRLDLHQPERRLGVDEARCHPLPGRVDPRRPLWDHDIGPDGDDRAVAYEHRSALDAGAAHRVHRAADDRDRLSAGRRRGDEPGPEGDHRGDHPPSAHRCTPA
jgi:hypothetical protein